MLNLGAIGETSRDAIRYKCVILGLFWGIILLIHIPWTYIGDDLALASNVSEYTLYDRLIDLYYSNGKICTDLLANVFYRIPYFAWKVFDSAIYVVIAMLVVHLFTEKSHIDIITVCFLLLLFPFDYISTAGYICVSTNYTYTTLCVLLVFLPIKASLQGKKINLYCHLVSLLSIIYATNQDQSAMCLLGGLFLLVIYLWAKKVNSRGRSVCVAYLIVTILCYAFMFSLPGHINRMTSTIEMELYLPEYANWSLLTKIYRGYSSTVSHIMFNNVTIYGVFCFVLMLLAFQQKSKMKAIIGMIPFGILLIVKCVGKNLFIYNVYQIMTDLYPFGEGLKAILGFGFSIIALLAIVITVMTCVQKEANRWILLLMIILAAGSREMMGFSPTIYASSYRTFIYFIFALIISCLIVLDELKRNHNKMWYVGMGAIAIAMI